jgi:crotonobetainyl-CoA:carnitine CoA-transferase CaiB-like acyl-CoA transferase
VSFESTTVNFRVLDLSTHISGPMASHLLADMGGDVLKLERPVTGDGNRAIAVPAQVAPRAHGESVYHLGLNSGARSIAVNRHCEDWNEVLRACVKWADVVIVGGRRRDAVSRGIDFDSLRAINPTLVYLAITGYGDTGPWADVRAHGQNPDALAGLVPASVGEDGFVRTAPGWRPAGTTLAGLHGALGVMTALFRRNVTGEAQYVSTSLWQSAAWWGWRDVTSLANAGVRFPDFGDFGSRYAIYLTGDARPLLVAPIEKNFWVSFCDVAGLDHLSTTGDWTNDAMYFGPVEMDHPEREEIALALGKRPLAEWEQLLSDAGVPFSPILSYDEAMQTEQAGEERLLSSIPYRDGDIKVLNSPISLSPAAPTSRWRPPPDIGQHTLEVLRELGLDDIASRATSSGDSGAFVE